MAPPAWHVLSDEISQSTELKTSGTGLIDMYTIPYVIDSGPATGHTGSIKVAVDRATPDVVAEMINNATSTVHALAPLAQDENGRPYSR
jgi:hypothetical protein